MQLALAILQHVPLWVWAILGYIVFMGLKQTREMRMSRPRLIALPGFWFLFGAWGVIGTYGLMGLPTATWVAGLALGLFGVRRAGWAAGARHDAESGSYVVPGSWVPLGLMLSIFCSKFAFAVTLAIHPEWQHLLAVQLGSGLVFGTISGAMLGRSFNILRSANKSSAALSFA